MTTSTGRSRTRIFLGIFAVLTALVWSPLGYGSYGPARRILGMPSWATVALVAGAVLFALEWFYLFRSRLALSDDELTDILAQIKQPEPAVLAEKE